MSEATDAEEREVMDWRRYGVAVRELAQMIADDGYRPHAQAGLRLLPAEGAQRAHGGAV